MTVDIDKWRGVVAQMTEGEWRVHTLCVGNRPRTHTIWPCTKDPRPTLERINDPVPYVAELPSSQDAEAMVLMRNNIGALLDEVERLRSQIEDFAEWTLRFNKDNPNRVSAMEAIENVKALRRILAGKEWNDDD